jgi:chloramphenicol-sensitive protein RarD
LVTLGLLQYLTPTLQFGLGVLYFHEDMPAGRWIGFGLVWVALVLLSIDSGRASRRLRADRADRGDRLAAEVSPRG